MLFTLRGEAQKAKLISLLFDPIGDWVEKLQHSLIILIFLFKWVTYFTQYVNIQTGPNYIFYN